MLLPHSSNTLPNGSVAPTSQQLREKNKNTTAKFKQADLTNKPRIIYGVSAQTEIFHHKPKSRCHPEPLQPNRACMVFTSHGVFGDPGSVAASSPWVCGRAGCQSVPLAQTSRPLCGGEMTAFSPLSTEARPKSSFPSDNCSLTKEGRLITSQQLDFYTLNARFYLLQQH